MTYGVLQHRALDLAAGALLQNVDIRVRREVSGLPSVQLYADKDGNTSIGNPTTGGYFSNGKIRAYCVAGFYRVELLVSGVVVDTFFDVPVGRSQGTDGTDGGTPTFESFGAVADDASYGDENVAAWNAWRDYVAADNANPATLACLGSSYYFSKRPDALVGRSKIIGSGGRDGTNFYKNYAEDEYHGLIDVVPVSADSTTLNDFGIINVDATGGGMPVRVISAKNTPVTLSAPVVAGTVTLNIVYSATNHTFSYVVQSGDTVRDVAHGLDAALHGNATLLAAGFTAMCAGDKLYILGPSSISTTISATVATGATVSVGSTTNETAGRFWWRGAQCSNTGGEWDYSVMIDGSRMAAAPIGSRSVYIDDCTFFGSANGGVFKSIVHGHIRCEMVEAGGTSGDLLISGASGAEIQDVIFDLYQVGGDLTINRALNCQVRAAGVFGNLSIDNAVECNIEATGVDGNLVDTVNVTDCDISIGNLAGSYTGLAVRSNVAYNGTIKTTDIFVRAANPVVTAQDTNTFLCKMGVISSRGYLGSTNNTPLDLVTANVARVLIGIDGSIIMTNDIAGATARLVGTQALGSSSGGGVQLSANAHPTAANHRLGTFQFGSYVSATQRTSAVISAFSHQAWTAGAAQGTFLRIETTSDGSATRTVRGEIYEGWTVGAPTGGDKGPGTLNLDNDLYKDGDKVVGARKTGWTVATGTATRTAFDTTTVTTAQLAERVKALIDDLHGTAGHGLIGA